jgi:phosphonate transport system ATP-binding protein
LLTLILEQHETAVVSLHNRRLALDHFDRILVMRDGRICCDLPTAEADEALLDRFYRPGADEAEEAMPEPLSDWALSRG